MRSPPAEPGGRGVGASVGCRWDRRRVAPAVGPSVAPHGGLRRVAAAGRRGGLGIGWALAGQWAERWAPGGPTGVGAARAPGRGSVGPGVGVGAVVGMLVGPFVGVAGEVRWGCSAGHGGLGRRLDGGSGGVSGGVSVGAAVGVCGGSGGGSGGGTVRGSRGGAGGGLGGGRAARARCSRRGRRRGAAWASPPVRRRGGAGPGGRDRWVRVRAARVGPRSGPRAPSGVRAHQVDRGARCPGRTVPAVEPEPGVPLLVGQHEPPVGRASGCRRGSPSPAPRGLGEVATAVAEERRGRRCGVLDVLRVGDAVAVAVDAEGAPGARDELHRAHGAVPARVPSHRPSSVSGTAAKPLAVEDRPQDRRTVPGVDASVRPASRTRPRRWRRAG